MTDLSIVIVNWNTRDLLARCLEAVYKTTSKLDFEVIVVDNGSTDGSQEMVRKEFPHVSLIANTNNLGFTKANNQAIRGSQGRYVLLLNSDAFVREHTIEQMVAFLDRHPEAGMAGCKLLYEDGRLQPSCYTFPTLFTEFCIATQLDKLFPKSPVFGQYCMTYWDFDEVREVDVIMGAFMLVRAAAIDQVGLMDERYFMYSEEVDWCYRFREKGWKIYFYPDAEAVHLGGGTTRQVRVEMLVQMYRSRIDFFRKHYGKLSTTLVKVIVGFNCLLRIGPGAWFYLLANNPHGRQKYRAFWQLLRALPTL
ncbi:MAG: glycosyltransferase family 2 protein [Anaerolineae bacterium]|nr:MAG: glycosyltransferase family 2 protein [Anaerolineae bacterium]